MGAELKGEIKNYIEQLVQKTFEKYMKIYSKEELLTKTEFLEAMKIIQQRFETMDKRFEGLVEAMDRGFMTLKVAIDSIGQRSGIRLEKTILKLFF